MRANSYQSNPLAETHGAPRVQMKRHIRGAFSVFCHLWNHLLSRLELWPGHAFISTHHFFISTWTADSTLLSQQFSILLLGAESEAFFLLYSVILSVIISNRLEVKTGETGAERVTQDIWKQNLWNHTSSAYEQKYCTYATFAEYNTKCLYIALNTMHIVSKQRY